MSEQLLGPSCARVCVCVCVCVRARACVRVLSQLLSRIVMLRSVTSISMFTIMLCLMLSIISSCCVICLPMCVVRCAFVRHVFVCHVFVCCVFVCVHANVCGGMWLVCSFSTKNSPRS